MRHRFNTDQKRRAILALVVTALFAGCGKDDAVPGEGAVETLPVVQSKSGGELVKVPAGSFTMGDSAGGADETSHTVSVSAFCIDRYAVTQEQFEKVMGVNPSKRKDAKNPVEGTRWTDAARFCNKCSELEGLTPCYDLESWRCNFQAGGYRLPTEAEWEYACRAGSTGRYCFGDDESKLAEYAWMKPLSQGRPHPVGQKQPNRWGLYDVHGNVWQWCNDWYSTTYYKESSAQDPRGPASGEQRVLRGGAWDSTADKCRAASRRKEYPVFSDACFGADSYGFRRARNIDQGGKAATVAFAPNSKVREQAAKKDDKPMPAPVASGKIDVAALTGTIVFVSDRSGTLHIWCMHASGKNLKQLTTGNEPDADPRFSPDGKQILYTTMRGGFPEIWMMKRDGSETKFVTKGMQAAWAPDGTAIVFIQDDQTYVRDLAKGTEKRLTPKDWEHCGVPAYSPDGKYVAVASRHLKEIGIFVVSIDGNTIHQLKTGEACCTPAWSKDGRRILCQSVQGHIHQVGIDGKGFDQLTFGADVQHDARYSPDGTMIVFCRAPSERGLWQLCLKRLDGDDEEFVQLTHEGSNLLPDWHPD
jgi:formylglycine-generating enzyme required for sulfatase activity